MDTVLSVFVLGISFGLILFLLAAGLSLTMGLMRIVNMAHGALYMVGGYIGLATGKYFNNFFLGVLVAGVAVGIIGLLLETGFLRRLYKQEASQVLLTIGFIYILMNLTQWIWGTYPLSGIVPDYFSGSVAIGTINMPVFRFIIIAFGLVMAALLFLLQEKTRIGARVRAGMDNREIAGALGINLKVIFTGIFALGSLIAGICGLIGAPLIGINLGLGWQVLLLSLIVVVVGGTGSIQGALLGGLLIGLLNAFGTAYFPELSYFIIYIALILILLIKPSGLLGRKMPIYTSAENLEETVSKNKEKDTRVRTEQAAEPTSGRIVLIKKALPYTLIIIFLILVPSFLPEYYQNMVTKVLIFALFAMSLDLIMGYTGLISFGHAAFFGAAGYTVGILTIHLNITSFWVVAPSAILVAAILSAIIGYMSLRVSGIYFLLVTMAFGQLLSIVATKWYSVTGGTDGLVGIMRPDMGFNFSWTTTNFYYLVFVIFVICFIVLRRIANSSFGRALVGIRENESRMRSIGFNTWGLKYTAVIVSGTFAGVAGVLFAYFYGTMVPSYCALETSALPMLMVIMGGPATLWGPSLGAAVIVLVQQFSAIFMPDRWPLLLGAIFVLCVMLLKGGFSAYLSRFWSRVKFQKVKNLHDTTPGSE